jgi:hypothetical protein
MYMNYEISVTPLFSPSTNTKISSAANEATLVVALLWIPSFGLWGKWKILFLFYIYVFSYYDGGGCVYVDK